MKFLIDNQLPTGLARWLTAQGQEASHVLDLQLASSTDIQIWELAAANDQIVVSKDIDFFLLVNRSGDGGRLLWVRLGNCRTATLLARFAAVWPTIQMAFSAGQHIVELR